MIEKYVLINNKIDKLLSLLFYTDAEPNITLESICSIKYGKSFEVSKLTFLEQYSVYGGNGIIGTIDTYMFKDSKICISCRGASSGNLYLTKPKSSISCNSLYLDDLDEKYVLPLFYYLKNINVRAFCTGTAQPQITIENIKMLKLPSSIKEKTADDSIINLYFLNMKRIENLKAIKQNLLSKYF